MVAIQFFCYLFSYLVVVVTYFCYYLATSLIASGEHRNKKKIGTKWVKERL